jgi:adenylate cyclase
LDPDDASAHQWFAEDISGIGGREQEALAEMTRAHQIDPLSTIISVSICGVLVSARNYDGALELCKKVTAENPEFYMTHYFMGLAYWGKRMYPQVIEEFKAAGQLSGAKQDAEFAAALEQGYRLSGWKGALGKAIEFLKALRKSGHAPPYMIGAFYADLGDKEHAFEWLNIAFQEHDDDLIALKTDFQLDSIRSDPRFAELVRKVGLLQ